MSENGSVFDEPLRLAAEEATRRLKEAPADLPAHALANMLMTLTKLRDREVGDDPTVAPVSALMALDSLPPERAAELLRAEISSLEERLTAHRLRLAGLEAEHAVA
jgi:hypothetical protein